MRTQILSIIAGLVIASSTAGAHHSFAAEFDGNKPIKLQGTVARVEWINPHAWIHLDVKNQDGTVTNWMIECGAPNGLLRRGFTKTSLPVGTEIVVNGWRAKDGTARANGSDVQFPDGRRLFVGTSNNAPSDGK